MRLVQSDDYIDFYKRRGRHFFRCSKQMLFDVRAEIKKTHNSRTRPNYTKKKHKFYGLFKAFYGRKYLFFFTCFSWHAINVIFIYVAIFSTKSAEKSIFLKCWTFWKTTRLLSYIYSFLSSVQDRCVKWWLTRSDLQNRQVSSRYTTQLVHLWLEGRHTYANNKLTICTYNEEWQNWFLLNS